MPTTLLASQVPIPIAAPGLLDPSLGPIISPALVTGDMDALRTKFNELSARTEDIARWGAGVYAVGPGLVISAGTGLNLSITAGQAMLDSVVTLPAAAAWVSLPDNTTRVHVWLTQAGAPALVANSLTPPPGVVCYLGSAVTAAGAITSVDTSGVLRLLGGIGVRVTADTGAPGDTPSANTAFLTLGAVGSWFWDGTQYRGWGASEATIAVVPITDGADTVPAAIVARNRHLRLTGALGAQRNLVLPAVVGEWVIINECTNSVLVKTAGGAGIVLPTVRSAILRGNGTDILRVTPNVDWTS